ncbi:hypothetical protein [Alishewanella longhuensis]
MTDTDIGEDRADYPQLSYETHQHGAAQARGEFLIALFAMQIVVHLAG